MKTDANNCRLLKKQLAFTLARQQIYIETEDDGIDEIIRNSKLTEHFKALGKDLDVLDAKTPEDIYKTHLENTRNILLKKRAWK